MSSLTLREKAKFEVLFEMEGGYVGNYSNSTFGTLMASFDIDIHSEIYSAKGTSKANKFREFCRIEPDDVVAKVLQEIINTIEPQLRSPPPLFPGSIDRKKERRVLLKSCEAIVQRLLDGGVNLTEIREKADEYNANYLSDQIRRIEMAIHQDPELAIGTAKEIIETCCRTILKERDKPVSGSPDISNLTKATLRELQLVPEGVPSEVRGGDVVKRILQNLGAIGNGLAELRGLYGTGHGKDGQATGLTERHARLAANTAIALASFLFDTHKHIK